MTKIILSTIAAITLGAAFSPAVLSQGMSKEQQDVAVYKGIEAIKAHQYSVAIGEFTKLSNNNPSNGEYIALRGSAYYDSGEYGKAKTDFENAIKKGYNKHLIYEQLNNAIGHTIAPNQNFSGETVGSLLEKASAAIKAGDYPTSIGVFTFMLDKKMPTKVLQGSYIGRGQTFLMMGRKENARVDAQSAINSGLDVPQSRDLLKKATQ
ncbi:MAG: hypothetical protein DKT66_23205 [Candidatus Melainabacteria bacterium]|nr:MAG: hypothetical protein DKT66_23205 [Candidatus Melainabacteria bacterium]